MHAEDRTTAMLCHLEYDAYRNQTKDQPTNKPTHGQYVLRHNGNGKYVAQPGLRDSYTSNPYHAKTFPTLEQAQADACGNETPVRLRDCE